MVTYYTLNIDNDMNNTSLSEEKKNRAYIPKTAIFFDSKTGKSIVYKKTNFLFDFWTSNRFIIEYDICEKNTTKVNVYTYFENRKICSYVIDENINEFNIDDPPTVYYKDYSVYKYIYKSSYREDENLIGKINIKTLKFTPAKKWYGSKRTKGKGWKLTYPKY